MQGLFWQPSGININCCINVCEHQVVGQLDNKFIACLMQEEPRPGNSASEDGEGFFFFFASWELFSGIVWLIERLCNVHIHSVDCLSGV
jgi:hypothetical protein